jgi:hypothetical protein
MNLLILGLIGFNRFLTEALQCFFPSSKMGPADFRRCIPSLFFEAVIDADEDVERVMGEYAALVNTSLTVHFFSYQFYLFFRCFTSIISEPLLPKRV